MQTTVTQRHSCTPKAADGTAVPSSNKLTNETVAQGERAAVFPRRGRPSATVTERVNANMDAIAQARDDVDELQKLQAQERLAMRDCRCAEQRLHSIDCALRDILARKADLIHHRRHANIELTGEPA